MKKVLVELELPSVGTRFDAYVPAHVPLYQLMRLMAGTIGEISGGKFFPVRDTIFCDKETGAALDMDMNAQELCLHNGSCLLII